MGLANKASRCNGGGVLVNNLAAEIVQQQKQKQQLSPRPPPLHQQHCSNCLPWRRRPAVPWTVVCGLLLFAVGLISLFTGHVASDLEWYSQRLVSRAWYYKKDKSYRAPIDIWKSKFSNFYYGCSDRGPHFAPPVRERFSNGYLLIATSGGLNQQRTGITDAVVVARILNATLVVPELDHHSFWKDESDFVNIFDVDWFISYLAKDVPIVKRVPEKVMRSMDKPPYTMRVPRKSEPDYYLDQVLPILLRRRVVQLTKFDYRLANDLDEDLQKLRCRVNYHALRFTKPLRNLGQRLVTRMRKMAKRFIAVHLRYISLVMLALCEYTPVQPNLILNLDIVNSGEKVSFEPDMLAFSGCYYGGGEKERHELGEIRKRWETLPELSPDEERTRGKCPLAPHEEMLASEELKSLLPFSSRLAAIDYIVCDESDVFVTNNNGNMAKILSGRSYPYMHTVQVIHLILFCEQDIPYEILQRASYVPNGGGIWVTRGQSDQMPKAECFVRRTRQNGVEYLFKEGQILPRGFMGEPEEMRPGRGEFQEYPSACICHKPSKYLALNKNKNSNRFLNVSAEDFTDEYIGNEESGNSSSKREKEAP
ncbi:hypothetical protein DH2020_028539 [Rehmannia glutinosa]|uniref:O-fucosyltransferase family protein n=1 Tax=Rehmannia glutinosa TaxID=99300 RepID=A0ABR0VUN5_REHGL